MIPTPATRRKAANPPTGCGAMKRPILLILLGAAGCGALAPAPYEGRVSLREGERARLGDLVLRFERVENDSRCAPGAQCVREGEAVVVLQLSEGGTVRLRTAPPDSTAREVEGRRIALDALSHDQPYRAWITVERIR